MEVLDNIWLSRTIAKMGMRWDFPVWADDTIVGALDAPRFSPAGSTEYAGDEHRRVGVIGITSFTTQER